MMTLPELAGTSHTNVKKICRYQQYFAIKEIIKTINSNDVQGNRQSGVIWHTQGSGKSLTMVMLAKYILLEMSSLEPKVVIVTDRKELDKQIAKTFTHTSIKLLPANTVAIVARSGILKHTLPIVFIPFETTVNQDIKILVTCEKVLSRYVFFALKGYHNELLAKTKKQGGTVDSLEMKKFMDFEIPVPDKEEQERIVKIIERFECLCNDITTGRKLDLVRQRRERLVTALSLPVSGRMQTIE